MTKLLFSYAQPILWLFLGLPIMVGGSSIIKDPRMGCVAIFFAFVIYNLLIAKLTGTTSKIESAWAVSKMGHFIPGIALGLLPIGTAYIFMHFEGGLSPFRGISLLNAVLTLATVSYEEFWFRGSPLELAATKYSKIGAALIFGIIFSCLHAMNPKIDLLQDGFQLLLAGYTLGVCYFAFGSIWAPIGMHFANNLTQSVFGQSSEPRTLFYLGPLILVATLFTFVLRKRIDVSRAENSVSARPPSNQLQGI